MKDYLSDHWCKSKTIKDQVCNLDWLVQESPSLKLVSAIFHYFFYYVLFGYFEQNTLKRNLTYSCFIFPLFHEHLFSHELPRSARLRKISCFEKITVCVIEAMLVTLPLVQRNKARREVNQQIKRKSR